MDVTVPRDSLSFVKMKSSITLKNVRVYAYHGCLHEEAQIGSWYQVDMTIWADLSQSIESDKLQDTIDYVRLNRIIEEQMAIRSALLEHVAGRILQVVNTEFQNIISLEIEVAKINPPTGGHVEQVSVKIIS